ncbi:MAG: tRNA1(Val) (adenine(37)-N6)-methyltransferase [Clostridia bacterium]|nr:tRNA1(Val) (adenine(37)-N6)-methyltransferase [Clostridia bacterium]
MSNFRDTETIDDLILGGLRVIQKTGGFRFSLDAVLLAHFVAVKDGYKIIDLGTGTGVIPLILTTRARNLEITGVEIQEEIALMAQRSIKLNNLEQVTIFNADLRALGPEHYGKYDLVVSNPPYLPVNQGKISPIKEIALSKHEITCTLEDLVITAGKLAKNSGKIALIHRAERLPETISLLKGKGLEPKRLRAVHPYQKRPANLILIEAVKGAKPGLAIESPLIVYNDDGTYSDEILTYYNGGETGAR